MDRRAFVVGTLGLLAAPLAARAQQPVKVPRIGWLSPAGVDSAGLADWRIWRATEEQDAADEVPEGETPRPSPLIRG